MKKNQNIPNLKLFLVVVMTFFISGVLFAQEGIVPDSIHQDTIYQEPAIQESSLQDTTLQEKPEKEKRERVLFQ